MLLANGPYRKMDRASDLFDYHWVISFCYYIVTSQLLAVGAAAVNGAGDIRCV